MNTKPTEEIEDKPALIQGARIAQEDTGSLWDQIADYFDAQRDLVKPRIDKNDRKSDY